MDSLVHEQLNNPPARANHSVKAIDSDFTNLASDFLPVNTGSLRLAERHHLANWPWQPPLTGEPVGWAEKSLKGRETNIQPLF